MLTSQYFISVLFASYLLLVISTQISFFLPFCFCLWSNKEIRLGAKYFPLRVFKHWLSPPPSLDLSLQVSPHSLRRLFLLPVVVCDVKTLVELTQAGRDHSKGRDADQTVQTSLQLVLLLYKQLQVKNFNELTLYKTQIW